MSCQESFIYRKADAEKKIADMKILKGEKKETEDMINTLIGIAVDMLSKK